MKCTVTSKNFSVTFGRRGQRLDPEGYGEIRLGTFTFITFTPARGRGWMAFHSIDNVKEPCPVAAAIAVCDRAE